MIEKKIRNRFGRTLRTVGTPIKRYKLFSILAVIGTVTVGLATFTESVDKIANVVIPIISSNKPSIPTIEYASLPEAEEKEIIENTQFGFKYSNDEIYSISLRISAKFSSDKFNVEPYLRSLSEIEFADNERLEAARSGKREADWGSLDELILSNQEDQQINHHELTSLFVLKTNKKPADYQKVAVRMGAYNTTVSLGAIGWKKHSTTEKTWWGAHGNISITIPDPTWVILREARILGGDPPILEVTLDNRGDLAVPLNNVVLVTSHPRESNISCDGPDQPQQVALLWPSQGAQGNTDGSWTEISNHKVKVPTRYNFNGECSHSYAMEAEIPVLDVVEPGKILRLSFTVEKLPGDTSDSLRFKGGIFGLPAELNPAKPTVPRTLQDWMTIQVWVEPKDQIFPGKLDVDHKSGKRS